MDDIEEHLETVKRELLLREGKLQVVEREIVDIEHRLQQLARSSRSAGGILSGYAARITAAEQYRERLLESLRKLFLQQERCREEVKKAVERKQMLEEELAGSAEAGSAESK
jgi:chromosome segregation ATPase